MGNCINCIISVADHMTLAWENNPCRKKVRKPVVLLVVGLDNAGKSSVVNYILNKSLITKETVVPTIGFRTVTFNYESFSVRMYDIGGGSQIRALWPKYYADVHGVIYVVDTHDVARLSESSEVLLNLLCHELITQKPILLLGNKQDLKDTVDELELIHIMNIENIVNFARCFTRIEICSCFPDKRKYFNMNKNIDKGFEWLMSMIETYYYHLNVAIESRKANLKLRRSSSVRSWAAESVDNPYYYSDTESESYLRPIALYDEEIKRLHEKQKLSKSLCCIFNNRTAPLMEKPSTPTTRSMKDLLKNIKLEDLIRNTEIDEDAIMRYERPKRKNRKRPNTAPSTVKAFTLNMAQRAETAVQQVQIIQDNN